MVCEWDCIFDSSLVFEELVVAAWVYTWIGGYLSRRGHNCVVRSIRGKGVVLFESI